MSTPTSKRDSDSSENKVPQSQAFTSPPSTRALGLVAIAVLVGFLLVMIVDSNNNSDSDKQAGTQQTSTTTTAKSTTETTAKNTTTTTVAVSGTKKPSQVTVLALNGSSGEGIASAVTAEVKDLGYKTLAPGNDSSKDKNTIVYYKSGFEKDAKQLATNIVPGVLEDLNIEQKVTTKQFPASAPITWDQINLVAANLVVVVGNP